MPFRLLNGVYAVRCRHERCPFNDHLKIEHEILGVTEDDVRTEALKAARDMASVKHDSIYGRRHDLYAPEIRMVSGVIQKLGAASPGEAAQKGVLVRRFERGEVILHKGEAAAAVCEVLAGSAFARANRKHLYGVGDCFGVAALVPHQKRISDVIANSDGTVVAFYRLNDLKLAEPGRASRVVTRIVEDTVHVVDELTRTVDRLRKSRHRLAS